MFGFKVGYKNVKHFTFSKHVFGQHPLNFGQRFFSLQSHSISLPNKITHYEIIF